VGTSRLNKFNESERGTFVEVPAPHLGLSIGIGTGRMKKQFGDYE